MSLTRIFFSLLVVLVATTWSVAESEKPVVRHGIVSYSAEEFAGWPANEGCWSWGDEILVGYTIGRFMGREGAHSIDPDGPQNVAFSRSKDGGLTWVREFSTDAAAFRRNPRPAPAEALDFSTPGFALKFRYGAWHASDDRGQTWRGPYALADFGASHLIARTNYVVTGRNSALVLLTSSEAGISALTGGGRSFAARTTDGGLTFEFLSWIGPDLSALAEEGARPVFSTMPAIVQVGEDHFVGALRQRIGRRKWSDIYESRDGGRSWSHVSELERGSTNPIALVGLGEKRIAAIYGSRNRPFGIRAKISGDAGHTWSEEIVLRDDGRTWDIGYPRAVVRPDGTIVILYYYTTEAHPEQHIATTLWAPPAQIL